MTNKTPRQILAERRAKALQHYHATKNNPEYQVRKKQYDRERYEKLKVKKEEQPNG